MSGLGGAGDSGSEAAGQGTLRALFQAGALAGTRLIITMLFGVSPLDAVTWRR